MDRLRIEHVHHLAERAGIEPATAGFIRLLPVLKTGWNTSSVPSVNSIAAIQ